MEKMPQTVDLLVVAATAAEIRPPSGAREVSENLWAGDSGTLRTAFAVIGIGQVNAAFRLGAILARIKVGAILNTGIGGAYTGSGLKPGDLAVATVECDADMGVEPPLGDYRPAPLSVSMGGGDFGFCRTDPGLTTLLLKAAKETAPTVAGPFLTSSTVTASGERASGLELAWGAVCENMEGAACARAAQLAGAKFTEVRGISNMVGPRDVGNWRVGEAVAAASRAVSRFIEKLEASGT